MRYCEAHNGISALLVNQSKKYDGIWVSSLTESAAKGMPDNELLSPAHRLNTIREIRNVTGKPIMVDWDTGGSVEHFPYWVRQLENAGVDIIMIEDKCFPKKNSLLEGVDQHLEDVQVFSDKIREGKEMAREVKIMARLESLIAKRSVSEAVARAEAYIAAGADGIMVHSKEKEGTEILEVAAALRKKYPDIPLVAVPTTYTLEEGHPFDYVVDANMLLRTSVKAMRKALELEDIKDADMVSVKEIFNLVGF